MAFQKRHHLRVHESGIGEVEDSVHRDGGRNGGIDIFEAGLQ